MNLVFRWLAKIWIWFFLGVPFFAVLILSFLRSDHQGEILFEPSLDNYFLLFNSDLSFQIQEIVARSFVLALFVTFFVAVFSMVLCLRLFFLTPKLQKFIFVLVVTPFFLNLIVRIFAIKNLVKMDGVLHQALIFLGWQGDPFALSNNFVLQYVGMILIYMPLLFFPLWASFRKVDLQLLSAGADLGANSWQIFWKLIFPQVGAGFYGGLALVFVPCVGEFVIPDLLGGGQVMYLGHFLGMQFLKMRNWPLGAATTVWVALTLALFFLFYKLSKKIRIRWLNV